MAGSKLFPPCGNPTRPRRTLDPGSPVTGSSLEMPRGIPLGMDPDERRCASALLAAKTDVADEGVPVDASAAEEQGETGSL